MFGQMKRRPLTQSRALEGVNELQSGVFPSLQRRGGRSQVTLRQCVLERGVSATTPTAPFKGGFAAFY